MEEIVKKNFNSPDETAAPAEKLKVDTVTFGDKKFQKITAEPGWKWSEHVKPVAGTENCEKHHLLYMISGKLVSCMTDGKEEEFEAGEVGEIPPGHDGWTVGNEPAIWLEIPQ
jgi:hypothetical protein